MSLGFNEAEVAEQVANELPADLPRPVFVKRGDRFGAPGGIYVSVRNATQSVDVTVMANELPIDAKRVAKLLTAKWKKPPPADAPVAPTPAAPAPTLTTSHRAHHSGR